MLLKIIHQPTGIEATSTDERSELRNQERAIQILQAELSYEQLTQPSKIVYSETFWKLSRQKETVRVYDYQYNLITNLRWGQHLNFDDVLQGDIHRIIESCISQDRQERLAELADYSEN